MDKIIFLSKSSMPDWNKLIEAKTKEHVYLLELEKLLKDLLENQKKIIAEINCNNVAIRRRGDTV